MEIDLFNDEFPLFVLLTWFVGLGIRPANHILTTLAENIVHAVQPSDEHSILRGADSYVDTMVE